MPAHSIKSVQKMPVSIEKAWDFFSDPAELRKITPGNIGFKVISKHQGNRIYAGQIIEYTVKPLFGISLYWMTEIVHVKEMEYFIDEQRKGPYKLWHHQHHFKAVEGGVEMTDIVHYKNPVGWFGQLANSLFVKKKLREIFEYRFKKIEEILGQWPGEQINLQIS